ncbi:MAG: ROK family protein [Alphaproteobacteria bacterium]
MRIGIDVGGTKIEALALGRDGQACLRRRQPTPSGDYEGTVRAIAGLARSVETELGVTASIGIGIPGSLSPESGRVRNANSTCLNGRPLKLDLETALGREVRIANDANCFVLSEASDGAGANAAVVFGAILGTGVGGGIAVEGKILDGRNRIAGEWGHTPLPRLYGQEDPVAECWCGRRGCIESFLSGPGMTRDHAAHGGHGASAWDIARAAEDGDDASDATLTRYEERLARALAVIINVLDPGTIVLGGGISNISRLYRNVPRLWQPHVFSDRIETALEPPAHGDSSGVRGAAWLWPAAPG